MIRDRSGVTIPANDPSDREWHVRIHDAMQRHSGLGYRINSQGTASVGSFPDAQAGQRPSLELQRYVFPVEAVPFALDLGDVPVSMELDARALLSSLPRRGLSRVTEALKRWVTSAPVQSVHASVITDPEARHWREVVVEAKVDATADAALALWEALAVQIAFAKNDLTPHERALLDRHLGIHVVW